MFAYNYPRILYSLSELDMVPLLIFRIIQDENFHRQFIFDYVNLIMRNDKKQNHKNSHFLSVESRHRGSLNKNRETQHQCNPVKALSSKRTCHRFSKDCIKYLNLRNLSIWNKCEKIKSLFLIYLDMKIKASYYPT